MKPVISALHALTPVRVTSMSTGEIITWEEYAQIALIPLLDWVLTQTQNLYDQDPEQVRAHAVGLHYNAAEYARSKGYVTDNDSLPYGVKAKSRLNRLVGFKLMSETASYVRNLSLRKNPHKFSHTVNLGAVDAQMVHLEREGNTLVLTWKCWLDEYELVFTIPKYALERVITKWSLPVVSERGFVFTMQERPVPVIGNKTAGLDLGRVEPFTLAILSTNSKLEAEYRARPQVRATNAKRERILAEVKHTRCKADAYQALGLDDTVLRNELQRMRAKAFRLADSLKNEIAADVTRKLTRHEVAILHIEDLRWATGTKYGSKWAHGRTAEKIEHTNARHGVRTKRVSARGTSQSCHSCRATVTHNTHTRVATCQECRVRLDRDVNAALNIAKNQGYRSRLADDSVNAVGTRVLFVPGVLVIEQDLTVCVT